MKTKVQAQRKFAQGAYVPPNANVTNTVVNRRVDPTNGKPKSYFFQHNTSARKLLDSISFESIHKHNPIVLLERLQEQPIVQMDDEPNASNELPTPAISNVTTKAQVHSVQTKVTNLTNTTQNITSCTSTKLKADNKIRKVITKTRQSKNSLLKSLEQKGSNQKFNMVLRSCDQTSAVDEDFSIDDDKPLTFYTKKTLKPKQMTKKQNNSKNILKTKKGVLNSPQPAETELSHNTEESQNNAVRSHSEVSFANQPEKKSSRNEISKRNKRVNSKVKKIHKRTLNHHERPSLKKANHNVSSPRNEALNNKEVLKCNGTKKKHTHNTKHTESPRRKEISNGNDKDATKCVEDTNLQEAPNNDTIEYSHSTTTQSPITPQKDTNNTTPVKLPLKIQLALAAHVYNVSNRDVSQLTTFARSCPVAKEIHIIVQKQTSHESSTKNTCEDKNGVEVYGAENDTVSEERPERPLEATHISKTCKFCKSLINIIKIYQKTVRHGASLTLNSGFTISQVSSSITTLLTALETGKLASHILPLQFILPIPHTSEEKEVEERRNTVAYKEKQLKKIRQSVACQETILKKRRQSVVCQETIPKKRRQSVACQETIPEQKRQSVACQETIPEKRRQSVACQETILEKRRQCTTCQETIPKKRRQSVACQETIPEKRRQSTDCQGKPLNKRRHSIAGTLYDECVSPTKISETQQMDKSSQEEKKYKTYNTGKGKIVEAPSFRPTEAEFRDPVAYFQKITPEAAKYGLCKVIAPPGFKPTCTLTDSIRFVVTNQYLSRFYSRWGPVTRELCSLRSFLASQNITFSHSPLLEGLEVNLPKMLHFVQRQGGLKANVESRTYVDTRKWNKLAEELNYTKLNNPAKKLDQIYVKYLLPYDALTQRERQELTEKMDRKWSIRHDKLILRAQNPLHRQKKLLGESDSSDDDDFEDDQHMTAALNEAEECVVRGRVMNLANFKKIATTARKIFFPSTPSTSEIESQYWKLVLLGNEHVCVNTASIDTGVEGYGFTKNKNEHYGKHPWNLKMLSQNSGNVLRSLGPVLGVTVPTLHLGMIYSTSCWHRDPHGLPWIEYMHTGPEKIWYGIPDAESNRFRRAVESVCPTACQNKSIWLPSDIAMIPPSLLLERNVSMSRVVQKPGEYIIVFPKAYSCSICTGYTVSESVYFATNSWVKSVNHVFQELRQSCEPTMFSLEQLLISVARDPNASLTMLQLVHESFSAILSEELENRRQLEKHGLKPHIIQSEKRSAAGAWNVHENECEVCRSTLYLSRVKGVFRKKYSVCLRHTLQVLDAKHKIDRCETETFELEYFFSSTELEEVISSVIERLTKT